MSEATAGSGDLPAQLREALPRHAVVSDPGLFERYARDVTGRFYGIPAAVVRPAGVEQVAALLRLCNERRIAVVPQGGNTGLVGGATPFGGEVVLSLERLTHVGAVEGSTVVAGAGATLAAVHERAGAAALELPIDFAARGSATVGGMVATDAGGALTMRHGTMRDLVAGLQVVLADGTVVDHLRRSEDSTGFDVTRLMCGSEGTLGVVTGARLKLVPAPAHRAVALVATASLAAAARAATRLRDEVAPVEAVDFFLQAGLDLVRDHAGLPRPFRDHHAAYLVVSCAARDDPAHVLAAALDRCDGIAGVAVAQSALQRDELWAYRELHNAAVNAAGIPHKLDVGVAPARVPELVERVDVWLARERPRSQAVYYGHLAAGNVHVNVLGAGVDDESIDEAILRIVAGMDGSISAEHGIGRAKNRWLHLSRSPGEIAAMRTVKDALDPNGILNPGKLLPDD